MTTERATFDEPWAMAFLPGTPWLAVTERTGALHLIDPASGKQLAVAGTPRVRVAGQGGLGDVVPGPTFAEDGTVYLSWVEGDGSASGAVVGRGRLTVDGDAARLDGLTAIWRQPPTSGGGHFSHRLAFSPDGAHLFVSSGDRQKMEPAQDLSTTLGKILRLLPDGTPAPGNPFADRPGAEAIWSYGHRNVLGLDFDEAGRLWASEMGPQGGDELNLIEPGGNYGWPRASNGSHYGGGEIPDHADGDGFVAPSAWWTPSVSPGSLLLYTGDAVPAWRGDALLGALSGQALLRVDLEDGRAVATQTVPLGNRIRAVQQGPDGSLWLLEDGAGGRLLQVGVG
ncbi:PQQ-dependent sugar dehydrogenase [Propioniciclava coleopterorum]|uniref:PQQ-dependent sugar dehydrogenase n=1 Tax=Propioniciclava coleopterorum TaxID=2714937 RepID=A0A6G7Y7H6_9ACTN|nr:PQQ-dependent sugar dehydrogenase [Propioniciclava coleopterorum]QIK72743.1 PQQ-dependent sugar dehydrogenase [Propioniciclava coleopterorum]